MKPRAFIKLCMCMLIIFFAIEAASVSSFAVRQKLNFVDVNSNQWFYSSLANLNSMGRLRLYKERFRPYDNMTLDELVPMIMSDKYVFKTSEKYISTAMSTYLISDTDDIHEPLTKLKTAEILCKYYGLKTTEIYFSDADSPAANALYEFGIINPYPINNEIYFCPDRKILKCEAAYMVSRLSTLKKKRNVPLARVTPAKTILPIAMYHEITIDSSKLGHLYVSPQKFEEDMQTLLANGYTPILPSELDASMQGYIPLPKKPVMVTFDDGYKGNYTYAFDIAKKLKLKFSVSIISNNISRPALFFDAYSTNLHLSENEMYEMFASGLVDFQNHTYNLHNKYDGEDFYGNGVNIFKYESKKSYLYRLTEDFNACNSTIKYITGQTPVALVYPMGFSNFSSETAAKNCGFSMTMLATEGINDLTKGTALLKRVNVDQSLDSASLLLMFEEMRES